MLKTIIYTCSMIKIGTDICSLARIEKAYNRFGDRFMERILTEYEIQYVKSSSRQLVPRFAGRFAAKEAAAKMVGTGWYGLSWKEIEIRRKTSGEPELHLLGRALALAQRRGLSRFEVSISHEREFAVATVLAYGVDTF